MFDCSGTIVFINRFHDTLFWSPYKTHPYDERGDRVCLPPFPAPVPWDSDRGLVPGLSHLGEPLWRGETPLEVQVFIEMFITPALSVMMME